MQAVREAARLCRAVAAEISPEVLAKKDKSPVTVADFGSQALVARTLAEAFPDDPDHRRGGLGRAAAARECGDPRPGAPACPRGPGRRRWRADGLDAGEVCRWIDRGGASEYRDRFWTLDPIDGTKGFLRGEQYADRAGAPRRGAGRRGGAGMSRAGRRRFMPCTARGRSSVPLEAAGRGQGPPLTIHVSGRDDPAVVRFCESVESGHSAHGDAASIADRLGITAAPLRMDSQAKYAVVARGEADIYLRLPTRADYREKIWDHAAGALMIAEAGGTVTDIHGKPLEFHHGRELAANRGVIVTNGRLHDRVLDAIRELGIGGE